MKRRIELLTLYTLIGEFKILSPSSICSFEKARKIVQLYIVNSGYTNLREVEDEDSIRFIADPPIGRKGRNVASYTW